jgi:uncharacterized protein (DUF885 family)
MNDDRAGDRDALLSLAAEAWDAAMAADPIYATVTGDRRFDDRLPPNDPDGVDAVTARYRDLRKRAGALPTTGLTERDRVTATALVSFLDGQLDLHEAGLAEWTADPLDGPQVGFLNVASFQPRDTPAAGDAMAARWAAMGPWIDQHVENLRTSLRRGLVSPASPVTRVVDQLDGLLGTPDDQWPLLEPARTPAPDWDRATWARFEERLTDAVRDGVRPAFARYRAFLADELLPAARSDDHPGLVALAGGLETYGRLARAHTSLDLTPEAIHRIGLDEVARVDVELADLGTRVLGSSDRAAAVARLRGDPELHFRTSAEVHETAIRSFARAEAAVPAWFGILPRAACEVVEMGAHEAEHSTIAYYREPAEDGSRPGRYYVNTLHPETRPRYEAEALAFHESVPGHHLQVAIATELPDMPAFRRLAGSTAFIEGWGLYTERLSDEMGLYSGDLDRIGIRSFDGWRASRLVVDTGMHALGWTRRQAIEFMLEHTALAPNNIANEVDRYISGPGQALAYKLGQLELLELRERAREALGPRFDIRRFHDVVLGEGALALRPLAGVVDRWLSSEAP